MREQDALPNPSALRPPVMQTIGGIVAFYPKVTSTNDEAKKLACSNAPEGIVVVADFQSEGRGRRDRRWLAPPGSSLLFSILFRPDLAPHTVQQLTMISGLGVIDAVHQVVGLRAMLKWPNDVLIDGAKLGGILTEVGFGERSVQYAVVGIGLNVNVGIHDLPSSYLMTTTSLSETVERKVSRWQLLGALLSSIDERYAALQRGISPLAEWTEKLAYMGEEVTVSEADASVKGIAEGVDRDGALRVRLDNGNTRRVLAGDVTIRASGGA